MIDSFILLVAGSFFAILTFFLNNRLQLGGIMASAAVSVIAGLFFHLFPNVLNENLSMQIPLVAIGASFVGMASSRVVKQMWIIGISGMTFSVIFLVTGSFFEGYGGSLGTTAFIALGAMYSIDRKFRKKRNNK